MEGLSTLLLLALIVIVLVQNSNLKNYLLKLEREIKLLQKQLHNVLLENVSKPIPPIEKKESVQTETAPLEPIKPIASTKPYVSIFSVEEREKIEANAVLSDIPESAPVALEENIPVEKIEQKAVVAAIEENIPNFPAPPIVRLKQPEPPSPSFFERHPDMEKFIGENLVNKIGIAILVLAIGFFVKYAIDQNWVGPIGRVAIGLLCGGILIGIAHKMRNSYRSFSSVLAGGGLAVFYFTITLAYKQFGLFGQTTAFAIMLIITAFAVALSILYDKQELAIISLVGGFIAPFLVSTGSGNYITLFIYLIVLNSGLIIIAYNKSWRLLNLLSFIFTIIMFGSWLFTIPYDAPAGRYANGLLFAIIFYLLFFAINIAYNVSEKKKFIASDFGILLVNTALFFGAGLYCLNNMGATEFRGLFSACMGIFNLLASYFLFRKQKVDTNVLYLLIGITLTFISITAPLQLHGNYITLFWASEAVLLFWLYTKSKINIIQYASLLVWFLMMISLLLDWLNVYNAYDKGALSIVFNKVCITGFFAAIATYCMFLLGRKEIENNTEHKLLVSNKNVFRIISLVILFLVGLLEINYQFNTRFTNISISTLYSMLYALAFILVLVTVTQKVEKLQLPWKVVFALLSIIIILYLIFEIPTFSIQREMFLQQKNTGHFVAHWFSFILIAICIYKLINLLKNNKDSFKELYNPFVWIVCAIIVAILSIEINLISNTIFYSPTNSLENIARVYGKTGLPILWGVCSFAFMWLGMRNKFRTLRIISLSLFSITLFKLFAFDIRNIPAGGKIAAFFCLGVLLLVVSFMYQRLKKIIIDDEKAHETKAD
jgi:Predicted membrane protein (DUF2339)